MPMASIEIVLLGTGSPLPDAHRAGPSQLVRAGGRTFLVDCGRGVMMRASAAGAGAGTFDAVLLTHLHSDHITDLGDVITSRWITTFEPTPMRLVGPPRTGEVLAGLIASLGPDISYRVGHHADLTWEPRTDLLELTEGVGYEDDVVRVVAGPTDHRPVQPTVGYRFEHDGHVVVLAGDTVPCEGLDELCKGAEVLVITVVRQDLIDAIGLPRLIDVCDYHSTVQQAAETAERAGVATLVLTHGVPPIAPGSEDGWRAMAAEHFGGEIVVAADLDSVTVG